MNSLRNSDKHSPINSLINNHKRDTSLGNQFQNITLSMNNKDQNHSSPDENFDNEAHSEEHHDDSNDSEDSSKESHQNPSKSSSEEVNNDEYLDPDHKLEQTDSQLRSDHENTPGAGGPVFYDDSKPNRRFRRRYNQIVRKYNCSFPGCNKSYGSLNHLNTHIVTKKHGQRKSKSDFHNDDLNAAEYNNGNYWYGYLPNMGIRYPYMQYPYQVPRNFSGQPQVPQHVPQPGPHSGPVPPQMGQYPVQTFQNLPPGTPPGHFMAHTGGHIPPGTTLPPNMAPFQFQPQMAQTLPQQQQQPPQHPQHPQQQQHLLSQNPQQQSQLLGAQVLPLSQVGPGMSVPQVAPQISQLPTMQHLPYQMPNQSHPMQIPTQSPSQSAAPPPYGHLYQQGSTVGSSAQPPAQSSSHLQHLSSVQNSEQSRGTTVLNQGPNQIGTPVKSYQSMVQQSSQQQHDIRSPLQNSPAQSTRRPSIMLLPPIQAQHPSLPQQQQQQPQQQPQQQQQQQQQPPPPIQTSPGTSQFEQHQSNRINLPSIHKLTEDKS